MSEANASQELSVFNAEPPPVDRRPSHIVGVGASAGGLEALERLFESMPVDTGLAFVVVQHLSPDFKSLTDELLGRRTAIPIHRVENGMAVERDAIYLIPPKKDMIVANGRLLLTDKDRTQFLALPIDHFFRSLAQDVGDRAVGVVLSGTGSDGSRGIRDIHMAGGLVIAQAPDSPRFDGMPKSAIETGAVAFTLPPEQIPTALLHYAKHPLYRAAETPEVAPAMFGMEAILRLIRESHGIDFSQYKAETVARRTERRLMMHPGMTLDDYARRLADDADELNHLYCDLLIGVTRFFRDEEAFDRLARDILPGLLRNAPDDEDFRAWVAACATGEEAYSLAILIRECLDQLGRSLPIKIFATDVHRHSLDVAGAGIYPESSVADIDPARRQRFFVTRGSAMQVAPELRQMVVFAHHNVLKDAPFTKLDLISCRNLLIYFQPAAQEKVLSLFHFGLKANGTLILGPSEGPGELGDEFDVVDARWKFFRKRRDIRLPPDIRLASGLVSPRVRPPGTPAAAVPDALMIGTYDALLDEYAPPSLLVNEFREVVQAFGGASRYLRPRDGRISIDLLEMVDQELRMALAGALPRVFKELAPVAYKGLRVQVGEVERTIDLTVKPVRNRRANVVHALVCLVDAEAAPAVVPTAREIDLDQASKEHLVTVEAELRYTKENLQAMIEEMETSNEELQASNEELVAANEELQSTNEELHSVNEELYTVNAEYQKKILELTEVTNDMDNLLSSTEVHTIFLDRELRIRRFTPKISETFALMPHDVGRRIDNFAYGLDHEGLMEDLKAVLETQRALERQVRDRRGVWFLLRVLPYRAGLAVEGVVLTLVDLTAVKLAEGETHRKEQQLRGILGNIPNWVFLKDLSGRYVLTDESFKRHVGTDPVGRSDRELFSAAAAQALAFGDERVLRDGTEVTGEIVVPLADGPHDFLVVKFPIRGDDAKLVAVGGITTDITALKRAESEARRALEQRDRFLAMLSHELRNPLAAILNAAEILGATPAGPDAGDWVRMIERRARHMARLLDDLLDVARITQDKIDIRRRRIDLATTMDEVLEEARPWFSERDLHLDLERPDHPVPVEGDPARLHQIQVNLLMNAAKYTPAGGRVGYAVRSEGGDAVVEVSDTGVGMSPEVLERVFDLFVQADETLDRARGGIGVGLTLVKTLVELHGGRVAALSDGVGKGFRFVVRLPLSVGLSPPPAEAPTATRPSAAAILLVEDDADIRQTLAGILALRGHAVEQAADADAALAILATREVAVALIDIGIPGMDGFALAAAIRDRFPKRPTLVALTGYAREADRRKALDAGFDAHLAKPVSLPDLFRVLGSDAASVARFSA